MRALIASLCLLGLGGATGAAELNWFEWPATAPLVVDGAIRGEEGRYTVLEVANCYRGQVRPGATVLIDLRRANRDRLLEVHPRALRLEMNQGYAVLLEPSGKHQGEQVVYSLVRGVNGARLLPPEGAPAITTALARFVEIQNAKSESYTWTSLTTMLDEANPILVESALDQFVKFRRGDPELTLGLVPLLDHPLPHVRTRSAELIGQIVARYGAAELPEERNLRGELVSTARRDPEPGVRVAACRAMGAFEDPGVDEVLREIAGSDPEQEVRYEAEKLLFERRSAG